MPARASPTRPPGASEPRFYGRVSYLHAGGIDRPLSIWKEGVGSVRPHQNWRGQFARGTWGVGPLQGRSSDCAYSGAPDCIPLHWPGYRTNAWHQQSRAGDPEYWMGSLVDGMRDVTGQIYMRNRMYDPATGQFTQPDPIGIAGGLNSYGFAAGDPVTYSDPYGLCKRDERGAEDPECRVIITLLETTARVADLSDLARAELLYAANVYERFDGDVRFIDAPESTSGGSMPYFIGATSADQKSVVRLNTAVSAIDLALVAYHEAQHLAVGRGLVHNDDRNPGDFDPTDAMQALVYSRLPRWLQDQATETRRYLQGWRAGP